MKTITKSMCSWAQVWGVYLPFLLLIFTTAVEVKAQCDIDLGTFGITLDPASVPKFTNDLPVIKDLGLRIDYTTGKTTNISVKMEETFQDLGLGLTDINGAPVLTRVWGYRFPRMQVTYPGATIVALKDKPIEIKWKNQLPGHFLPVDGSLHMAHPVPLPAGFNTVSEWYAAGNVPTVAHLHGGHTESASDGLPEAWFTQDFMYTGNYFAKQKYWYDNDQEAATLWYHDHALGITRLNVYAGLAGFYLLRDENENALIDNYTLPGGDYEIEMVIQDRLFDQNGQLFWPAYPGETPYQDFITGEGAILPPDIFINGGPTALAEFFGNIILVNGKAWPKLNVEPRKYRFRLLNGSDSRFYVLKLNNGEPIMVIGSDDGLLTNPVEVEELVFAPGERYDVVINFSDYESSSITLLNLGPDEPYNGVDPFDPACSSTTGKIMQFKVNKTFNQAIPNASVNSSTNLRPGNPIVDLVPQNEENPRKLVLFEGKDEFGRLQPMLGTMADGSLTWNDAITENPSNGATELWEVYNATGDAHPIHLHLVKFQILNRQAFTTYENSDLGIDENVSSKPQLQHNGSYGVGGIFHLNPAQAFSGGAIEPDTYEGGWKDTFVVPPGHVGRIVAKFDRLGRYVWHCHILSHEDHEMMRPFQVGPLPANNARIASNNMRDRSNSMVYPNPFIYDTQINFELKRAQQINFSVYDMTGKRLFENNNFYQEGKNAIFWDGFGDNGKEIRSGVYIYKLTGKDFDESKRLIISR